MGDSNCDLSIRNKTLNCGVMCFIIVSLMITNNIYVNHTRPTHYCYEKKLFI